jgi:mutator protein MutT
MTYPQTPRFCHQCGGPLKKLLPVNGGPPFACASCGQKVYLDPKVAAAAVVRWDDGRVMLLRRAQRDRAHGLWILPGGHVDRGEVAEDAALREVAEETGLQVELERLLGVYTYPENPVVLIVYLARPIGGELAPGKEALEMSLFDPAEIPWDELGYHSTGQAIKDMLSLQEQGLL